MTGCISMSTNELERYQLCIKLEQRLITQSQVAEILSLTSRQVKRIYKNYKNKGHKGLISLKRGNPSNNKLKNSLLSDVTNLIEAQYLGFGPTLAHEKLTEIHKLKISLSTVRKLMILKGLWKPDKIKKSRVYQLRERLSSKGELIQMDGSPHAWFEERGNKCSLLITIDDATGSLMAGRFVTSESLWGYFELMKQYIKDHGRPRALYVDKHSVFKINRPGALSGNGLTDFGRAMKECDIELIYSSYAEDADSYNFFNSKKAI